MATEKCPEEADEAFKLTFLRCEVFNVERAVARYMKYWNARVELFGEEKAFLPMKIDGAMEDDAETIGLEYLQVANETDPDGRAILLFDFTKERGADPDSLLRVIWYQVHVALMKESCQKRGVVVYARDRHSLAHWRLSLSKKIVHAGRGVLPIRFAGMHIINPPTFHRILLSVIKPALGKKLRNRFYTHSGSVDDLLKSLGKFGLGTIDLLPEMFGGQMTLVYLPLE